MSLSESDMHFNSKPTRCTGQTDVGEVINMCHPGNNDIIGAELPMEITILKCCEIWNIANSDHTVRNK